LEVQQNQAPAIRVGREWTFRSPDGTTKGIDNVQIGMLVVLSKQLVKSERAMKRFERSMHQGQSTLLGLLKDSGDSRERDALSSQGTQGRLNATSGAEADEALQNLDSCVSSGSSSAGQSREAIEQSQTTLGFPAIQGLSRNAALTRKLRNEAILALAGKQLADPLRLLGRCARMTTPHGILLSDWWWLIYQPYQERGFLSMGLSHTVTHYWRF
jgi:hypothetical protein